MSIEAIGNREETNIHAELFGIFSRMKKELLSLQFLDTNDYKKFISIVLTYRDLLTDFYFEHDLALGDSFSDQIIKEGEQTEKGGKYGPIMNLLRKDHTNPHGQLSLENSEKLDDIFMTVLHGQSSTSNLLDKLITSDKTDVVDAARKFFTFYLSQLLWSLSYIQEDATVIGITDETKLSLGNNLKLLSFDINNKTNASENNDVNYETVDSIFPHVYVRNPEHQANIFLGYDAAQKRIQTIQEKNAIKKAIEEGDESQRLQNPENGQARTLPTDITSLKILTKEELPQKELIYQRVLALRDCNGWLFGHTEGVQTDPAAQTVAEKRGRKQFLKQVAYVEEKMQGLPEGIAVKEIDTIIFRLLHPLYKKNRNIQRRTPFYLPSSGKKYGARAFSEQLIRKYCSVLGEVNAHRQRGNREPSKMYARKYESIKQFCDNQRKEKLAAIEKKGQQLFHTDESIAKNLWRALGHTMFSDGDKATVMAHQLLMEAPRLEMRDIQELVDEFLSARELLQETKQNLSAAIDKVDRPQIVREIQQEVQAERNDKFVHDEKTIQHIYYAILHQIINNANIVRNGNKERQDSTFASLDLLHEVFTDMLIADSIDTKCLDKAYQQVYMHYRATGIDAYGIQDILAHIKKKLSPGMKIDVEDMTKVLQRNYDEYVKNKIYITGHEYRGAHYEELADIFGVKLTLRKKKTMEDLLVEQIHTPQKIEAIDYIGNSYAQRWGMEDWTIDDTQKHLQENGSLMLPENARAQDIREIKDITPDQWLDIDSIVPIGDSIPQLHFQSHANRSKNGMMEGNYVLWYNAQTGMLELVYDTTLRTHYDIMEQYNLHPSSILGGGYATINKGLQEILLESYMPTFLHEPRIISVVAFKNAFKEILPDAKIIIGEDGMQNIEHHFDREYDKPKEPVENPDELPF